MTDEDKNLLELAAKAAGLPDYFEGMVSSTKDDPLHVWNPLKDDGDALRLAVKLQLGISIPPVADGRVDVVTFDGPILSIIEYPKNGDRQAAIRRAIVRAASEVGKSMTRTAESVDPIIQMIRDQEAKKNALIAEGICPTCKGEGECGGQFTGGEWTCEDCNGSGRTK